MTQALRLAVRGGPAVAPNPQVGAVIVKDNRVIGKGYHRYFGGPHAEIEAINNCHKRNNDPEGAVMFVTLEPCCHHGKTPPCTEAIAAAGIACVEIATLDKCDLVAGKGAKWLKKHGNQVKIGCCEDQARQLNAGFFKLQKTRQPLVILKWAQSIDGKLAWPAQSGRRWITNEQSRRHVHQIRSRCGAILVGIGTVLADDPMLNVRTDKKKPPQPIRIVLDEQLAIPLDSKLAKTAKQIPLIIFTLPKTIDTNTEKADLLGELGCQVLAVEKRVGQSPTLHNADDGLIDLSAVLDELGSRGITDLLVEGGPTVLNSFHKQHLADRIMAYIAPVIIGNSQNVPSIDFKAEPGQLKNINIRKFGDNTLIQGDING